MTNHGKLNGEKSAGDAPGAPRCAPAMGLLDDPRQDHPGGLPLSDGVALDDLRRHRQLTTRPGWESNIWMFVIPEVPDYEKHEFLIWTYKSLLLDTVYIYILYTCLHWYINH